MLYSKKAIQGHIFVLLIISIFMSLLLTLVLNQVYGNDKKECALVNYTIIDACKENSEINLHIKNNYNSSIEFIINGKRNILDYRIIKNSNGTIKINDNSDVIELVPMISVGDNDFQCESKSKNIYVEKLKKCQE